MGYLHFSSFALVLSSLVPGASLTRGNGVTFSLSLETETQVKRIVAVPCQVRSSQVSWNLTICSFYPANRRENKIKKVFGEFLFCEDAVGRGPSSDKEPKNIAHVTSYSRIGLAPMLRTEHDKAHEVAIGSSAVCATADCRSDCSFCAMSIF